MLHGPEVEVSGGSGDAGRDCRTIEEALPFYPRGDLARGDFSAITRHLARCRSCRLALFEVQASYRLLQRHLFTASTGEPGAARVALMARLRARATALILPPQADAQGAVLLPVPIVRRPGPGSPGRGGVDGRP